MGDSFQKIDGIFPTMKYKDEYIDAIFSNLHDRLLRMRDGRIIDEINLK